MKNPSVGVSVSIKPGLTAESLQVSSGQEQGVKLQLQDQGRGASIANLSGRGGVKKVQESDGIKQEELR